jgi:benzoyl-CoA 2,3-epoxidase subunit A
MSQDSASGRILARQHLIDPEVCIRCNTCESTCPSGAVTHDDRNYVVSFDKCNACGACISPCPTGAIDHWREVLVDRPYSTAEQLSWEALPAQTEIAVGAGNSLPQEVTAASLRATSGQGGTVAAPWSAESPRVNLYSRRSPAVARIAGNLRLTESTGDSDIRHIVLDFGGTAMPILEGQTIGIVAPGVGPDGRPHDIRLYSVASPRDGERAGYNNLSITVRRVTQDHAGNAVRGICSNYLCDLTTGQEVAVVGPYGASFLMPNHPGAHLLMICTGTGSAPMRAMTERRRRRLALKEAGSTALFFGARSPAELPYFGPLMKLPREFIDVNLAFSRVPGQPKQYVQDLIRARHEQVARLLADDETYIYVCGVKGMEAGVEAAFADVCRLHDIDWQGLAERLRHSARFHVETY